MKDREASMGRRMRRRTTDYGFVNRREGQREFYFPGLGLEYSIGFQPTWNDPESRPHRWNVARRFDGEVGWEFSVSGPTLRGALENLRAEIQERTILRLGQGIWPDEVVEAAILKARETNPRVESRKRLHSKKLRKRDL